MARNYSFNTAGELEPFLGGASEGSSTGTLRRADSISSQIGRIRSNSVKSIRSTYESVREHFDKRKFLLLVCSSVFLYLGFISAFAPRTSLARDLRRIHSSHLTESEIFRIYLNALSNSNLAGDHVRNYTTHDHEIGDKNTLKYTIDQLQSMGFQPKLEKYYPWINKPLDTQVNLFKNSKIVHNASMIEDCLMDDPITCQEGRIKGYHGYSANGTVLSQYVFSNYGTIQDYEALLREGIDIEGKIHIIRYGKLYPGAKVKNAELYGASGVIMYTDPYDDGFVTERNGFEAYPKGPARQQSSIERSSVAFFSEFLGDPTTPGYSSKDPSIERLDPSGKLPRIPSVPLSAKEIKPILHELRGRGIKLSPGGNIEGFDYYSGPSDDNVKVQIINNQIYEAVEITNVIVEIPGVFSEFDIVVGNHRDYWTLGGAGSPNSGSAILLEISRGMSALLKKGWKPLRPIKLISWDGGALGNLGSTEYVEEHFQVLKRNLLVYLNLDSAITGPDFNCQANPLLQQIIREAAKYTQYKDSEDVTLFEKWTKLSNATIGSLDGISDCSSFQFSLGIPSAQFSFEGSNTRDPIHQRQSLYDTHIWMEKYVDKDYELHNTLATFAGITTLLLSEKEPTVFTIRPYFDEIWDKYIPLHHKIATTFSDQKIIQHLARKLSKLIAKLQDASSKFDAQNRELNSMCTQDFPVWQFYKKFKIYIMMARMNAKLRLFDQLFLTQRGLDGRSSMKHSIYAPDKWTGNTVDVLPGLHEAIQDKDDRKVVLWLSTLLAQFGSAQSLLL